MCELLQTRPGARKHVSCCCYCGCHYCRHCDFLAKSVGRRCGREAEVISPRPEQAFLCSLPAPGGGAWGVMGDGLSALRAGHLLMSQLL